MMIIRKLAKYIKLRLTIKGQKVGGGQLLEIPIPQNHWNNSPTHLPMNIQPIKTKLYYLKLSSPEMVHTLSTEYVSSK